MLSSCQCLNSAPLAMQKWLRFYFADTLNLLDTAKIISCDVFDTLLFRRCAMPHDLFQEVGLRLKHDGHLRMDVNPHEFVTIRTRAENRARAEGKNSECTLDDIARKMEQVVEGTILKKYELAAEQEYCFLNDELTAVLSNLKGVGKKIFIVSDTYFSARELALLLKNAGFPLQLIDELFVSSDVQVNKAFGGMYKRMGRACHLKDIIHIGDNLGADVTKAKEYGIAAQHIPQRGSIISILEREKTLRLGTADSVSLESLRELVGRQAVHEPESLRTFFTTGATVFGPSFARYAEWCVADCVKNNVTDILAFTREAETLVPLLKNAALQQQASINVIPLYVSRQALAMASLDSVDLMGLMRLMHKRKSISYERQLLNLGLHEEKYYTLFGIRDRSKKLSWDEVIALAKAILNSQEASQQIAKCIGQKRKEFLEYFSTLTLGSGRIAIADLGFAGRTQTYLCALTQSFKELRVRGYYFYLHVGGADHAMEGRVALSYMGNYGREDTPQFAMVEHPEALEQSLISQHGTTLGYADGKPVLEIVIPHYYQVQETEAVRRGILAFQAAYAKSMSFFSSPEYRARVHEQVDTQNANILHRFFTYPTKEEAMAFGHWVHDDNFGTPNKGFICNPEQPDTEREPYWPQGMYSIEHENQLEGLFDILNKFQFL